MTCVFSKRAHPVSCTQLATDRTLRVVSLDANERSRESGVDENTLDRVRHRRETAEKNDARNDAANGVEDVLLDPTRRAAPVRVGARQRDRH